MKKNWYVIYSRPQHEKKIVTACAKKKLESFFPLKRVSKDQTKKSKIVMEPLFISHIFVNSSEADIPEIMKIEGVISLMHYKEKPAIIRQSEIDTIKEFISIYDNITLETSLVNLKEPITTTNNAIKTAEGNIYSINSKLIKVKLPSLGLTLVAATDNDTAFGRAEFNFKSDLASRKQQE